MLRHRRPDLVLPQAAWRKPWVVHITRWGEGEQAVLDYLARYVFRVAITNPRLVALDDHTVTIRCKQRKSSAWRTCRITGDGVHPPLPSARAAQRLPQDPLLRLVASAQPRPRRPCPPPTAARPTRPTPDRGGVRTTSCLGRGRHPQPRIRRTARLPALPYRPLAPHSPAHAEKPDGTVTHPSQRHFHNRQPRVRRMPRLCAVLASPADSARHPRALGPLPASAPCHATIRAIHHLPPHSGPAGYLPALQTT